MKILIIDGQNQMHRAFHAYRNLQNNGKPASIVYGLPLIINALIHQFKPDKLFICWDGGKNKNRLKLLPSYKAGRKKFTDEERIAFNKQSDDVKKVLYALGLPQLHSREHEADDWIYKLTRKYSKDKGNTITIVSNDKDFHQLIKSNVRVFATGKRILLHHKNLKVMAGYEPKKCVDFLCLTGDKSDNIPGIRGVGEVRAKGFIERFSSIQEYLDSEENDKSFDKVKLAKIYDLNRQMIDLRYFYNKYLKNNMPLTFYRGSREPKFRKNLLFIICTRYSINTFKKPEFTKTYTKYKYT